MKIHVHATIIAAALIIGVAIAIAGIGNWKSDYITVGGEAEATVIPDYAVVYLTVASLAPTPQEAESANAAAVDTMRQALVAQGARVETSSYYLSERMDWTDSGPVSRGHEATHTLKATVPAEKAASAITAGVGAGATNVDRIEFLISREAKDAAVTEAMRKATVSAQDKARAVTEATGERLGRVLKIEEGNWWVVPATDAPTADYVPPEYAGSAISPERIAVQMHVNVVFAVR